MTKEITISVAGTKDSGHLVILLEIKRALQKANIPFTVEMNSSYLKVNDDMDLGRRMDDVAKSCRERRSSVLLQSIDTYQVEDDGIF